MNGADIAAFGLIFVGSVALLFVVFLKIRDKLLKRYLVRYECKNGVKGWTVIDAYSKKNAVRRIMKSDRTIVDILGVVRYRGE